MSHCFQKKTTCTIRAELYEASIDHLGHFHGYKVEIPYIFLNIKSIFLAISCNYHPTPIICSYSLYCI